jgi:CheY-like chemotaxis protein
MSQSRQPTVLVADDHEDDRELARVLLSQCCACRVVEAEDGAEAVELARRERPALIIMDLRMPGVDGYEAARRIRQEPALSAVPMVAYTAYYSYSLTDSALDAGFDEYVQKPVTKEQMREVVARYLKAG